MKYFWINKENNSNLIIFFNGWGMDEKPFMNLNTPQNDVITYYDYRVIDNFDAELIKTYNNVYLIAWSFGVWVANYIFRNYKKYLKKAIAINGTLKPINDTYGISQRLYESTCRNFNETNRDVFYKRMCVEERILDNFIKNMPNRNIEDQKEELYKLKEYFKIDIKGNIFNKIIIGESDKIIPVKNQELFWDNKAEIIKIPSYHFLFDQFQSWEDIIKL